MPDSPQRQLSDSVTDPAARFTLNLRQLNLPSGRNRNRLDHPQPERVRCRQYHTSAKEKDDAKSRPEPDFGTKHGRTRGGSVHASVTAVRRTGPRLSSARRDAGGASARLQNPATGLRAGAVLVVDGRTAESGAPALAARRAAQGRRVGHPDQLRPHAVGRLAYRDGRTADLFGCVVGHLCLHGR